MSAELTAPRVCVNVCVREIGWRDVMSKRVVLGGRTKTVYAMLDRSIHRSTESKQQEECCSINFR